MFSWLTINNSNSILLSCSFLLLIACYTPAYCQRDYDPNFKHFYMGRQQWTIEDDSPVIKDRTGTVNGGMNGTLQNRVAPLPKAGWQGYAPIDNPHTNNNLPAAPGKQRPKSSSHSKAEQKGRAGNLTGNKSPVDINSYKPYATYSNPASTPNAGTDLNTSTHVKGSLLHWARRGAKPQ